MILGKRDSALPQGFERGRAVKPGWSDEAVDRAADDVFDQCSSPGDPGRRFALAQAQELAFAGGHEPGAKTIRRPLVPGIVAVGEPVKHHLDTLVRPTAQLGCEGGPGRIGASPQ